MTRGPNAGSRAGAAGGRTGDHYRRLTAALVVAATFGALGGGGAAGAADRISVWAGTQLTVAQVIQIAYDAGYRSETRLLSVVAVAVAESTLYDHARNFDPALGYRPASDVIGVEGPASVWNASHTRQLQSDRGIWQVSSYYWPSYTDAQTDDPSTEARTAVWTISKGGTDFSPWISWQVGYAQAHFDAAVDGWPALRPIVRQFLAAVASVPGRPTVTSATAGAGWANVAWNAPSTGAIAVQSYTVTATPGGARQVIEVPGTRATFTGLHNGRTYRFAVSATNARGTGSSDTSASVTPSAGTTSVTTHWTGAELPRLNKTAAYLGVSVAEAQHESVGTLGYLIGLIAPGPTPVASLPPDTGSTAVSSTWPATDQGVLVSVMRKYALTPAEAQKFSAQLVGYLLALTGH